MKKFTLALVVVIFYVSSAFSQFFTKNDTLKIFRTSTDITVDGKVLEKCWDSTQWKPIQYVWAQNPTGSSETYLNGIWDIRTTKDTVGFAGVDSSDFNARFKMMWSSKTNMVYILVEVTDNVLISNYDWVGAKKDYTKFDDIEIFYQENGVCRSAWPGCDHTFTHKAKAIHLTSNGYGVDMGGPSWNSFVLYNRTMKSAINKAAPKYTWEIGMQLINDKVTDAQLQETADYSVKPLPDSLISKLNKNKVFGFTINYIDVDVAGKGREHFISNVYLPDGVDGSGNRYRNASWQNSAMYGTAKLIDYSNELDSTIKKDTTPVISIDDLQTIKVNIFPNPVKDILTISGNTAGSSVTVKITGMLGNVVAIKEFWTSTSNWKEEISLAGIPDGFYLVEVASAGQHTISKILKQ